MASIALNVEEYKLPVSKKYIYSQSTQGKSTKSCKGIRKNFQELRRRLQAHIDYGLRRGIKLCIIGSPGVPWYLSGRVVGYYAVIRRFD